MLRKTLLTLCAGAMLAAAAIAPNDAAAFGLFPHPLGLGGLHLGLGGPHPLPHFGGAVPRVGLSGAPRLGCEGFRGVGRSGVASGVRGSARYGRSGYAHSGARHRNGERYAGHGSGGTGSYVEDGCYYTYRSSGRRVLVCSDN
jgi:hypothetical protein